MVGMGFLMTSSSLSWFAPALNALLEQRELTPDQVRSMMHSFMRGECTEAQIAGLLIALRIKGESAEELATAARVIRDSAVPLQVNATSFLDTCGTGGDGLRTFNVSTATALVVAAAGVPVVKHGNRAVSGKTGSADVLQELGMTLPADPKGAQKSFHDHGFAFCLAPLFHPALRHVGAARRQLATRTMFNCLGPLVNPANAPFQLLGVGRPEWLDRMVAALARLGTERAFLVRGQDGLDEVTLTGPTDVREVRRGQVVDLTWTPEDFDLKPIALSELRIENATDSARVVRAVLAGEEGGPLRIVLANSAAALLVVGAVTTLREGVSVAREVIRSGTAQQVLDKLTGR